MVQGEKCRRCSKEIEKVKNCGEANCQQYIPGGKFGGTIKRDLGINLADKYFVDNLCNKCSDTFEYFLNAFYLVKIYEKNNSPFIAGGEGGVEDKFWCDTKSQKVKVWEDSKIWEINLQGKNIDEVLKSMNY